MGSIDRFSLLHDSLLSIIVSSLPFKDAVKTSTLSKDWENVCKLTRNIEFNELFFIKFDQPHEIVHSQRMAFLDFMKKGIENHGENAIDKFSLTMSAHNVFSEDIDRCIRFAIRNEVKDLELDFTSPTWNKDEFYYNNFVASVDLSSYVYEYSGLQSLKLYSCDFSASEMVNFHSLKEISLGFMRVSICAIEALLTNCEMLESLNFYKCWSLDEFILKGEYLGLKKLVINRCHFKSSTFRINAPNLKVFDYHGSLFDIDIQSPALDEVNLDFPLELGCQSHGSYYLHKLLKDLPSPRVMTVCSYWLQVLFFFLLQISPINCYVFLFSLT
ncbi:putative F-box domain, leucine-rich repeat domain, L domain-containing protein [Medicago truncatula]|uniref:Putative F-box domain, leucine-rich repeat domain, L domain-containing protein n=1 Tax=Medicago truncatula TaxID=3880 RepID=A0A396HUG7_MEDTR|nr:putative F-box domain, leucine-rich repeat domain, L domain-containing protein [Medicago truncatula]